MDSILRHSKRTMIGVLGGIIVVIGLIMIPYPGPGWLVVFLGFGVWATEFHWAKRLQLYGRQKYHAWGLWLKSQTLVVRIAALMFTAIVVIVTIWLLNGYGMISSWLHLDIDWLHSPFSVLEFLEH